MPPLQMNIEIHLLHSEFTSRLTSLTATLNQWHVRRQLSAVQWYGYHFFTFFRLLTTISQSLPWYRPSQATMLHLKTEAKEDTGQQEQQQRRRVYSINSSIYITIFRRRHKSTLHKLRPVVDDTRQEVMLLFSSVYLSITAAVHQTPNIYVKQC